MSKPAKFTFKKHPRETGLAGVANPYRPTDIKLNKKVIGEIFPPSLLAKDSYWSIRFTVDEEDPNTLRKFKWILLKARFNSEAEARVFLQDKCVMLCSMYKFHHIED